VTQSNDFVVYNMPGMLSREVRKPDPFDPTKWVRDEAWYESIREKMATLFTFYRSHGLLRHADSLPAVDKVVLNFSDFSELGQRFIRSGAADRWLASFDRPGSRRGATDDSYLERQLTKLT
jgi:hypothetical protein